MINEQQKKILIIDYKTGEEKDPRQLGLYKKIVRELPYVRKHEFSVEASFVDVEVTL